MKKIYPGIFIILFFFPFISAQNGNLLLKKIQDKYSSISSFSADFIQYSPNSKKLYGKFFYKKENNIKIETGSSTIVSNGSTNWNYNKKQNKVIITGYDDSDASMFSFNKMIFDFPSRSKVETDENDNNVLMLIPDENSDLNFAQAKFWINRDDLIKKIEITGKDNSHITIELSNYKLNQIFSDSQFSFTPPEGSKVIDLR
ncbi:MAG: outer-membrane lipoprotein carrier protein LolA [Ignavibacteriaceae bacterium]